MIYRIQNHCQITLPSAHQSTTQTKKMNIQQLQQTHLAVWNEKNRSRRDDMMATIYAADIIMYDPSFTLNGIKEVSDFIDKVQQDPQFDFKITKPMDAAQHGVRLFWTIKTAQGLLTGMDFFILEQEKVKHLYVFMDA